MERTFITCQRFMSDTMPCPHINEFEALSEVQDLLVINGTVPGDTWEEALQVCRTCTDYVADYRA